MGIPFPNVPNAPGVPQVPRLPGAAISTVIQLLSPANQGTLFQSSQSPSVWGVFDQSGNAVLQPESILGFDNSNEWSVSAFPIQGGQIATYNKVLQPFEVSMRMRVTGTVSERNAFLIALAAIAGDTNLYNVITPEWTYSNVNITRYANPRPSADHAYTLDVDVFFIQVVPVAAQYSTTQTNSTNISPYIALPNAQDPTAQPNVNQGTVNPQPVPAQTSSAAGVSLDFFNQPAG